MVWDDFMRQFSTMHICMLGQESVREDQGLSDKNSNETRGWQYVEIHGEWSAEKGVAGGLKSGWKHILILLVKIYFAKEFYLA